MAFKMKGFPMIGGTKPMKMKKDAAMKMKKEAAMKEKMNMVKGPGGSMVPDFAVDGKGANDMKSSMTMKKESAMKMKKGEAMKMKEPMKMKEKSAMKLKEESAKKMKTPMKEKGDEVGKSTKYVKNPAYVEYEKKRKAHRSRGGNDESFTAKAPEKYIKAGNKK